MYPLPHYINGEFVTPSKDKGTPIPFFNPSTQQPLGELVSADASLVDLAVTGAQEAQKKWGRLSRGQRADYLFKIAQKIKEKGEALAHAETQNQGKPLWLSTQLDIPRASDNFSFFASALLQESQSCWQSSTDHLNYELSQPLGVAGLISPWNLPLYLLTWKIAPALASGCTVVAKPSEVTPHTAHLLAQIFQEVELPPGVCQMLHGTGPQTGQAIVEHPQVPAISFTGGTQTGRHIAQTAAPQFKKLSLEMGGKNASLVLEDCDLPQTLKALVRACYLNQGQICLCPSRLLVQKSIYSSFVTSFAEKVDALTVGDPFASQTFMGPLVSRSHLEKVTNALDGAIQSGMKRLTKRSPFTPLSGLSPEHLPGNFMAPSVIECLDPTHPIFTEEVFGPVVTITPFDTLEEAIHLANATHYGLSATIWTQNLSRAHGLAQCLQAGTIWINQWLARDLRVPFGGHKQSGLGVEGGFHSLDFFRTTKNVSFALESSFSKLGVLP